MVKNRIVQHLLFWTVTFVVLLKLVSDDVTVQRADIVYTSFLLLPLLLAAYVNLLLLLPKYFEQRRFIGYAVGAAVVMLLSSGVGYILFDGVVDRLVVGYYYVPLFGYFDLLALCLLTMGVTSLLYFTKSWFYTAKERQQVVVLQQQKSEAELKLLKSQLNPHFLFNTLNSIYALVLKKSDYAADALVRLSDIIRYMVYETAADRISLERELEVLKAYIDLQKMRLNSDAQVEYHQNGDMADKSIAPMLLFPFVENAFKHGAKGAAENMLVAIRIDISDSRVVLKVANSKGRISGTNTYDKGGVGLDNVKQLLELLYPNTYELEVEDTEHRYQITLKIPT